MEERDERWFDLLNPFFSARLLERLSSESRWAVVRELWHIFVGPLIVFPLSLVMLRGDGADRWLGLIGLVINPLAFLLGMSAVVIWWVSRRPQQGSGNAPR